MLQNEKNRTPHTRVVSAGKSVLQPFGDNKRYDLAIDDDGKIVRIQCKTGWERNGTVRFNSSSSATNRGNDVVTRDYKGQADLFAVYCPDNDKLYMVPVDDVGGTKVHLRTECPKNKQTKGIKWAKDYEFGETNAGIA